MIQNDSARDVGEDRVAIEVYGEKEIALGIECEPGDVLAMCEWECVGSRTVAQLVILPSRISANTYLTRSNTLTRFPTGESRQVPSGVNRRLPLL